MCSRYSYNKDEAKLRLRDKIIRVIRGSIRHLIRPAATFSPFEAEKGSQPP